MSFRAAMQTIEMKRNLSRIAESPVVRGLVSREFNMTSMLTEEAEKNPDWLTSILGLDHVDPYQAKINVALSAGLALLYVLLMVYWGTKGAWYAYRKFTARRGAGILNNDEEARVSLDGSYMSDIDLDD